MPFDRSALPPLMHCARQCIRSRWLLPALLLAYLLVGLASFRDFGVAWDEPFARNLGQAAENYALGRLQLYDTPEQNQLAVENFREHGHFEALTGEMLLYRAERTLGVEDPRDIYQLRHLLTFLAVWTGTAVFLGFLHRTFNKGGLTVIAFLMLVTHPTLFGHAFFNSKDMLFYAAFMVGCTTLHNALRTNVWGWWLAHALACAMGISIRVMGVILPAATLAAVLLLWLFRTNDERRHTGRKVIAFSLLLPLSIFIMYPSLWEDPWGGWLTTFLQSARYGRWGGSIFFMGESFAGGETPWTYLPVWIGISTPPAFLGAFLGGALYVAIRAVRHWRAFFSQSERLLDGIFLGLVVAPVSAIIVLNSVIYDGWRHLFYIYPCMVYVALRGLHALRLANRQTLYRVALAALSVNAGSLVLFSVQNHPHQHVYFNALTPDPNAFEQDFWGLSYREGLEYVLAHDDANPIRIRVQNAAGRGASYILPKEQRDRLVYVSSAKDADYFLTCFRYARDEKDHDRVEGKWPYMNPIFEVRVRGQLIHAVYDVRKGNRNTPAEKTEP